MIELGVYTLAAFNLVMIAAIFLWWCCKICPCQLTGRCCWWSIDPYEADGEEGDFSSSEPDSPPPFDRSRKPSGSILKTGSQLNDLSEASLDVDVESDPFVQASRILKTSTMVTQAPEKRTRFEN